MVSMETGLRHEHMVPRLDLLGRNINSIVGNLWQRQEEHGSNSSNGNMSPGSGESGRGSPQDRGDDRRREEEGRGEDRPSIGIRSDLLPMLPRDCLADMSGLPALEALRRQAGHQNPFLSSLSPHGLSLTTKRPSQPPTPQSSTSGGDPSSAWSFEEQFKQLYEIDDNPKRKEFLDDLFAFMQKRGSPINRLPIMAKQVLDLYELYNLVVGRGGLVEVINKKQWQEIIKGLGLPSSITSAAFTLRTQYTKYLYPLEVNQHNFSNNSDLQNAIDGNKREGRRLAPYDMPTNQSSPMGHHRLPQSPTQSPPHHLTDPLAQLEMTRLALWKLYSHGQAPPPPPHMLPLPPLDLDLRRREHERMMEEHKEQMRAEEDRRRKEEARRRIADTEDEPAEKRIRVTKEEEEDEEEVEEEEEVELEVTRKSRAETTMSLSTGVGEEGNKSMKITMEVNGVLYSGVLYAKPS